MKCVREDLWKGVLMSDIMNFVALLLSPLIATIVGSRLQEKREKRRDKMQIFKVLMTSRVYGITYDNINALNTIDIVFSDDEKVRAAWKVLYEKYSLENPSELQLESIKKAQDKLIEEVAISLGYKDIITWESIQNPYIPKGLVINQQKQEEIQAGMLEVLNRFAGKPKDINGNIF